jgi:DNA-binding response OmpR family regulator
MTLPQTRSAPRATILVVDDQPMILETLCQLLQDEHEVLCATSGADALELAWSQAPDLVLLDVIMPGLDGFQVCEQLKADPRTAGLPVVFLTEWNRPGGEERGLQAGAIDYIPKPINPAVVKARVRTVLAFQRQERLMGLSREAGLPGPPRRRSTEALILLVEDDPPIRTLLSGRLGAQGVRVAAVPGARAALDFLAHAQPALILSDAVMPGMDGFQLCQAVKAEAQWREIPFAILTSLSRDLRERSTRAGADSYLFKLAEDRIFQMRVKLLLDLGLLRAAHPGAGPAAAGRVLLLTRDPALGVILRGPSGLEGMTLLEARTVPEAQAHLEAQVSLVVVDLDTSGLEGPWLAALGAAPGAPLLLALGPAAAGPFQDVLPKPLDPEELWHRIHLLLELAGLRRRKEITMAIPGAAALA